jgi:hypothetical protein
MGLGSKARRDVTADHRQAKAGSRLEKRPERQDVAYRATGENLVLSALD